jgi:hypothetical protein
MERAVLLEHLLAAKRHAELGKLHVEAQKRIVDDLIAAGRNTAQAEQLLRLFEQTQDNHLDHIERILDELDKLPLPEGGV